MKAFKIAISLLLIPRLFASLMLFPLILSLLVIVGQVFVTQFILRNITPTLPKIEQLKKLKHSSMTRRILYGSSEPLKQITVCRWFKKQNKVGVTFEVYPGKSCAPDRLDVALHVPNPDTFDTTQYVELFNGSFERLHICEEQCRPDAVITPGETPRVDAYSIWALMLLHDARFSFVDNAEYIRGIEQSELVMRLLNDRYFHAPGVPEPISIKDMLVSLAVIANLCGLIIVSLWLGIKAHRRVLDYFGRSGALLPMVAATGKGNFYSALWLLTGFRVGAFIIAAVPLTVAGLNNDTVAQSSSFGHMSGLDFTLWIVAMLVSMGLAALIASIADLKHRHFFLSFLYKFLPLILSLVGGLAWAASFIVDVPNMIIVRNVLTSLPLVGMAPLMVAPIVKPELIFYVANTLTTFIVIVVAARLNARWFAAHLEEL